MGVNCRLIGVFLDDCYGKFSIRGMVWVSVTKSGCNVSVPSNVKLWNYEEYAGIFIVIIFIL